MDSLRADPSLSPGLVRHVKKLGQRRTNLRRADLVLGAQDLLYRFTLRAGILQALLQLNRRHDPIRHQSVVFGDHAPGSFFGLLDAVANRRCQGFAKLGYAFDFQFAKSLLVLVVDHLQHAVQRLAFDNRRHHHLARAVTRALVNFLEESQGRVNFFQCLVVIDIGQVEQHAAEGGVAGNALRRDRQFQVAAAVESGLDLGDDGALVFIDHIQGEPVGVEQFANVLTGLKHDLLDVFGVMNARGDLLELLVKQGFEGHSSPI
ncbi:hypothetical protein GALL_479660 [mine drainage metagenome]|uniref:Uncharacterized protein n=1 Tax=mine drainage metagenome TaxID=410659 RepID=A0A1J5Q3H3_9ZZZZ